MPEGDTTNMSNDWQERLLKADINISSGGDNTIIAPGSGDMPAAWENGAQFIAIDQINLVPSGAVTVQFKDGSTAYGGAYALSQNQGFVLENSMRHQDGVITLSPNKNFVINLGSGVQVSGFVRYRIRSSN